VAQDIQTSIRRSPRFNSVKGWRMRMALRTNYQLKEVYCFTLF
jgi:hypothetical protein